MSPPRVGYVERAGEARERRRSMAEQEIRATHEEVEAFVGKLRDFYRSLSESEQAMLVSILEGAQAKDTGGYAVRWKGRYGEPEEGSTEQESFSGWNDLIGWVESQGDEDTQGFGFRVKG
jgi:hypothetical protein